MQFLFAIFLIIVLLSYQPAAIKACDTANWWGSLDREGWSVCPNDKTYLRGFFRNDPSGANGIWLLEEGKCCPTSGSYANQPSTCHNENWWGTLDGTNAWALCPDGYFMQGMYRSASSKGMLHNIEEAKCCRPQNHPNHYDDCYDEDVTISFDNKGWSECKKAGYYMTGFYKGNCDNLYCIEKFRCCKMKPAAVNGGWSNFGAWGQCSAACGAGQQERMRTCTNPPPSNGGAQCSGSNKETRSCNNRPCAVDGGWSDFGTWSRCSVTCGGGKMERTRTCTNPPPSHGGKDCVGDNKAEKECNTQACEVPNVDGGFTEWSEYSACSKTCGKGKQTRTRECTSPKPSGDGKSCKGKYTETKRCKVRSCRGL